MNVVHLSNKNVIMSIYFSVLVVVDMVEGVVVAGVEVEVLILHFVEVVEEEVDLGKKTN